MAEKSDLPQGTLDLLILKVVALGPVHGYAIAQRLQQVSRDVVQVPQGSLYPALHRLENRGLLAADWKETETGREAKFYRLTQEGAGAAGGGDGELAAAGGGGRPDPADVRRRARNDLVAAPVAAKADGRAARKGAALPRGTARRRPDRRAATIRRRRGGMARLALGGPEQVKEGCRDARGTRWVEDLWQDLRYAVRTLAAEAGICGGGAV